MLTRSGCLAVLCVVAAVKAAAQAPVTNVTNITNVTNAQPDVSPIKLSARSLNLPVTTDSTVERGSLRLEGTSNGRDPLTLTPSGLPKWNLGVRLERRVGDRLAVSAQATAMRGHELAAALTSELGTMRDLSITTPLAGSEAYQTFVDTAFGVSLDLKRSGRVRLRAIGEVWNPFSDPLLTSANANQGIYPSRTIKFGLAVGF